MAQNHIPALYPPNTTPQLASAMRHARAHRREAISALVHGSCDVATLVEYRRWVTVACLLGEFDTTEASDSLARAEAVFKANVAKAQLNLPRLRRPET